MFISDGPVTDPASEQAVIGVATTPASKIDLTHVTLRMDATSHF